MIETITIAELYARFQRLGGNELILDVRSPGEYAGGHIPGSRNISHDEVKKHVQELRRYERIHVLCRSGGRVQLACYDLADAGLTNLVAVVDGGMPEWESAGYPIER